MRRAVTAALVSTALVTTLTSCGDDAAQSASADGSCTPATLKVGVLPISNLAPLYVGINEGFFEDEGLTIEPVVQAGGAEAVAALVSGSLDVGWSATTGTVIAASRNLPIVIVAPGTVGPSDESEPNGPIVVTGSSPIREPADLEGKTVSINTLANLGDITIRAALDNLGVDSSTVKFVEVSFPDMPAMLEQGEVDAAWLTEPFSTSVVEEGGRVLFDSFVETRPGLPTGHWVTTTRQTAEKECSIVAFGRAVEKANIFANENPDAVRTAIEGYTEIPAPVIGKITLPTWTDEHDTEGLKVITKLTEKYADVEPVDIESLILETS